MTNDPFCSLVCRTCCDNLKVNIEAIPVGLQRNFFSLQREFSITASSHVNSILGPHVNSWALGPVPGRPVQ